MAPAPIPFITGYVAASLKGIDLDQDVKVGENISKTPLGIIGKQTEDKLKSVPIQEQAWDTRIASKTDGEAVYVVGIIYMQGDTPPAIPNKLANVFGGQATVQLPLKYAE